LINGQWSQSQQTNEGTYGVWIDNWSALAQRIYASAVNAETAGNLESAKSGYLRAFSYWFLAQWPAPAYNDSIRSAIAANSNASMSFGNVLRLMSAQYFIKQFDTSLTMGDYHDVQLPIIFISPDPSQPLPTLFLTSGTDFSKEAILIQTGFAALARGYAVVVYDGPGQGDVIRGPSKMPFVPNWEVVAAAIFDALTSEADVNDKIDFTNVIGSGVSLGGFLQGRACAGLPDKFAACVINPASPSMASLYSSGIVAGFLGPLLYVQQTSPQLLPGGYGELLTSVDVATASIMAVSYQRLLM
jgi:hypothetical protein